MTMTPEFTSRVVWPAFYVAHAQSCTAILSDSDGNTTGVLVRAMGISPIFEKRKATFDRIKVELDELVGDTF